MMEVDEEKLQCDLAETYNIYDIYALPCLKVALFSCGLGESSRIKKTMSGCDYDFDTLLKADISDKLSVILWFLEGAKESNKPTLITRQLLNIEDNNELRGFTTAEEFEQYKNKILGKG